MTSDTYQFVDDDTPEGPGVLAKQVQEQLTKILASEEFRVSQRLTSLLNYVVKETLAGRGNHLKAFTIAIEAFGCSDAFDPQINPLVRIHAAKLRRALERYYLTDGVQDTIRIELPKGSYVARFSQSARTPAPAPAAAPPIRPCIAVLPLVNYSVDDSQDYFADGLTEELVIGLSRFANLAVVARSSTCRYRDHPVDLREVYLELGARFLLQGSVWRAAQTVRVTIQLIDAANNKILWGERYDRVLATDNLFALQDEICQHVVARIGDQYGVISRTLQDERQRRTTSNLTAYEATLLFYHNDHVLSPASVLQALQALQHAVTQDPDYALAWGMLAELYGDCYAAPLPEVKQTLRHARQAARRALALDPLCQQAHCAMAYVHFLRRELSACIQETERAIECNPGAASQVAHAGWLMALAGQWERGLGIMATANQLNPYCPGWFHFAPYLDYFRRGEYEHALAEALAFNMPENRKDPLIRAAVLGQLGRREEAQAALVELSRLESGFTNDAIDFISKFIAFPELRERFLDGLRKAGLQVSHM